MDDDGLTEGEFDALTDDEGDWLRLGELLGLVDADGLAELLVLDDGERLADGDSDRLGDGLSLRLAELDGDTLGLSDRLAELLGD